jgi:hypothetical protein
MEKIRQSVILFLLICNQVFIAQQCDYKNFPDGYILYDFSLDENVNFSTNGDLIITQSKEGIDINIEAGKNGKIIFSGNWDLSCWSYLGYTITNNSKQVLRIDPIVNGKMKKRNWVKPINGIGWINPDETLEFNNLLLPDYGTKKSFYNNMSLDFPNMRGFPDGISFVSSFDMRLIEQIEIEFPTSKTKQSFTLKKIRAYKPAIAPLYLESKETFFPFIDKYGQYRHANWPQKIKNDEQFKIQRLTEDQDLKLNPISKQWNKYGGYKYGPKYKNTGHFRVEKINDKWWFIDPEGYVFWSCGVNSAGKLNIATPINGRRHFFEDLPKRENSNYYNGNKFNFGDLILAKKYGSSDMYLNRSLKRMISWGMNTMGGWSNSAVIKAEDDQKVPYTLSVGTLKYKVNNKLPDVFNDDWLTAVNTNIKRASANAKNDSFFIGFFVDNELTWYSPNNFVLEMFKFKESTSTKSKYIKELKNEFGEIELLNNKCGSNFISWNELKDFEGDKFIHKLSDFNIKFYKKYCEKYFKTISESIKNYCPDKLYLGCRWHVGGRKKHRNKYNIEIASKYVDVLSFNQYVNELNDFHFPGKENMDKPFIISEFNFGALDVGKFYPGLGHASSQRNRGEKYENFIKSALNTTNCIGAHWFMWANSTTAGRGYEGENANCGVLSETDSPYYELIKYMRKINYEIYSFRTLK